MPVLDYLLFVSISKFQGTWLTETENEVFEDTIESFRL